jgi:hypothetical protein
MVDYKLKIDVDASALEKSITKAFSGLQKQIAEMGEFTKTFKTGKRNVEDMKRTYEKIVKMEHTISADSMKFQKEMTKEKFKQTMESKKQANYHKMQQEGAMRLRQVEQKNMSMRNAMIRASGVRAGAGRNIGTFAGQLFGGGDSGGRIGGAIGSIGDIMGSKKVQALEQNKDKFRRSFGPGFLGGKTAAKEGQVQGSMPKNRAISSVKLAGIGAGLLGAAGLGKMIIDSSPLLKAMFKLLNVGIMLILRPIGDFIGFMLRPLLIEFVKKVAIPAYRDGAKYAKEWGSKFGDALLDFIKDPIATIASAIALGLKGFIFPGVPEVNACSGEEAKTSDPLGDFIDSLEGFSITWYQLYIKPIDDALKEIYGFFQGAADSISSWVGTSWMEFTTWLDGIGKDAAGALTTAWESISGWFQGIGAGINSFIGKAWVDFTSWLSGIGTDATGILSNTWDSIVGFFESIYTSLESLWNFITGKSNDIQGHGVEADLPTRYPENEEKLKELKKQKSLSPLENLWETIKKGLPHFADGGVVKGSADGEVVVAGEGGQDEVIVPKKLFEKPGFSTGGYMGGYTSSQRKAGEDIATNDRPLSARENMRKYGNIHGPVQSSDSEIEKSEEILDNKEEEVKKSEEITENKEKERQYGIGIKQAMEEAAKESGKIGGAMAKIGTMFKDMAGQSTSFGSGSGGQFEGMEGSMVSNILHGGSSSKGFSQSTFDKMTSSMNAVTNQSTTGAEMEQRVMDMKEGYKDVLQRYNETAEGGVSDANLKRYNRVKAEMEAYQAALNYAMSKYTTQTGKDELYGGNPELEATYYSSTAKGDKTWSGTYAEAVQQIAYDAKQIQSNINKSNTAGHFDATGTRGKITGTLKRRMAALQQLVADNPPDYSFASGGIINEPVFGLGKSGKSYQFGERGPETVTPSGNMSTVKQGDNHFHITLNGVRNATELEKELKPVILRIMQQSRARTGIL